MPTPELTAAQRRTLETCAKDRSIIFGGIDSTPGVRIDVVKRLAALGLLRWKAAASFHETSEWVLTDAGHVEVTGGTS